ncbi:site-specific DNA-methyltransferase [Helicobacter pylori]|uniref:site-specific DNA-methyltransferase n=1 Tax=Helicobacter pylori TaxID=210 RepID=UPI000C3100C9|nr:site-specific DNA-methyltransferase [Helicobacter pylori]
MTDKNQAKKMGINIIQSQQENNPLFDMLLKNFPQTIKDGQVSLSAIKTLLGFNESMNDISGYELTWTGKGLANALYSEPCQKQLKLQESFTPQTSASKHPNNAIIIGDNLDALKLLKSAYSEKIKMIYIDPPYNTGNDDFIYTDNFRKDYQKILREVGLMETDENGKETESESLKFFKNNQGSKTHSGWLSFMLPRLKLARDLLKEDGVIFISIDDNECANLKILCDEIFGEGNFVAEMPRLTKKAGKSTNQIAKNHDYVLCYQKNSINFKQIDIDENDYPLKDEFYNERGGYKLNQNLDYNSLQYNKKMDYEIVISNEKFYAGGLETYTERQKGNFGTIDWVWRWSKAKFDFGLANGFVEVKNNRIYTKTYTKAKISDSKPYKIEYFNRTKNISSIEFLDNKYSNDMSNKKLQSIFNVKNIFDYSKPVELISFLIEQTTEKGDIILDFFAGSGTTAHAVMELNAEDKGNREFILVQIDEEIKEDESAYDFCKNVLKSAKPIISDITIERVKRAAQKIIGSSKDSGLNLGFKVYTLQDKAQIANDKEEITLFNRSDLTPFDKALNLALQCGKTLNQPLEIIIKDKLYKCEDAYFCIVCDEETQEYLAKSENERIFLDGYEEIDLQAFLNLNASFKERLSVVY